VLVGLGHVDLVCSDLERSLAFYGAVFGALGLQPPLLVDGVDPDGFRLEGAASRDARLS